MEFSPRQQLARGFAANYPGASVSYRLPGSLNLQSDTERSNQLHDDQSGHRNTIFRYYPQGYRQMPAWMCSLGDLQRASEWKSTVSYGAGLLRFMQQAGIAVLEVTTPDGQDRRRRGKNDDLDAQNAAHAAFAGERTVTPRSRDGMMESLRVLP